MRRNTRKDEDMKEFIAKLNRDTGKTKTVIEHTKDLLERFETLMEMHPNALPERLQGPLMTSCKWHDIGKIGVKFQEKIGAAKLRFLVGNEDSDEEVRREYDYLCENYADMLDERNWEKLKEACDKKDKRATERILRNTASHEIPHALLSAAVLPRDELEEKYGDDGYDLIETAILFHHDRAKDIGMLDDYIQQTKMIRKQEDDFDFEELGMERAKNEDVQETEPACAANLEFECLSADDEIYPDYVKVKGLLNRIDYAASGNYDIEPKECIDFARETEEKLQRENPDFHWNDAQTWTAEHQDENIAFTAQTGYGKTEAALRWLKPEDKAFFVLPLKTAINAMFDRLKGVLPKEKARENLGLLHSDLRNKAAGDFDLNSEEDYDRYTDYINSTKSLSKQLTISTLDQIFIFDWKYTGYEPIPATLAYSKVIIDEIQMYEPRLLGELIYGLKQIQDLGGKFCIMTATLAPFVTDLMKKEGLEFTQAPKAFISDENHRRHKMKVLEKQIDAEEIAEHQRKHNGKTLVVCNTVRTALKLYDELKEKCDCEVNLIHSRFTMQDRKQKERDIETFAPLNDKEAKNGIWIGTQVIEASLDIDFDTLFTELSELNGLFQRMGRCCRRRNYEGTDYNVFVYIGESGTATSGIRNSDRSVTDWQLFRISKRAISRLDGYISEQDKIRLINENYTTENIRNEAASSRGSYLERAEEIIRTLKNNRTPISRQEATDKFRSDDAKSYTVIPQKIYERQDVKEAISELQNYRNRMSADGTTPAERHRLRIQRGKARALINSVTLQLTLNKKAEMQAQTAYELISNVNLDYDSVQILSDKAEYSAEKGLTGVVKTDENDNFM